MCCCGLNFGILFTLLYILTLACAVEIMNYLKEKLDGNAAEVILGLTLTNVNYDEAIKLLKERFGQNDIIINTHYTQLMDLPVASSHTGALRSNYDKIEKHLRNI